MFAPRGRGYESESEDEGRRQVQASRSKLEGKPSLQAGGGPDDKKKKKVKLPPQETIEEIWKRFSKEQFTKALQILPFDPVPASTASVRANELLTAGYERAADECRRRVRKIIQECKRVNKRYRDPGFDLDWDLKWRKGNTLNYLGKTKFELSTQTARDPSSSVPKAVKRVHEIFENPTFMKNINGSDVKQGGLGDCWLIASLSGLANIEGAVRRSCVEYNTKIGIYGFVFYRDGEWIYSIIDDKLFLKSPSWDDRSMQRDLLQQIDKDDAEATYRKTYQTGSKALFFGQNVDQNETWVPLMEKAYAKAHGDYASLIGGWIGEGLEDLTGGVTTDLLSSDILDTDEFWDNDLSKVNQEFLFGCSTGLLDGGHGSRDGIQERHAYNVVETRTLKNGTRLVKLRNPWGTKKRGIWEGAYSDGSKEWNAHEVQEELKHSFGSDSVFWITYDDLLRKFQHIDRTRLFREDGWRCSQRWIGVDVPWRAQWHEKFHVRLTRDSPLVLVLSQLDDRYFKGLEGQYSFELNFRVHEQGKPDPEDYVVRSHANYLMERSVGIEIPDMAAGNYSIWISVRADRNWATRESVEAVVKRECRNKDENEKLAQVGRAYDLAHAKAAQHLAEVARRRRAADHSKAADERKDERRTNWERRRINQKIQQAQNAKNQRKRERRKAERKAAAEKKAEEAAAAEKKAAEEAAAAEKKVEDEASKAASTTAVTDAAAETTTNEKQASEQVAEESSIEQDKVEPKNTDESPTQAPDSGAVVEENKNEQDVSSTDGSHDQTSEPAKAEPKQDASTEAQVAKPDDQGSDAKETSEADRKNDPESSGASTGKPTHIDVPPHADPRPSGKSAQEVEASSIASTGSSTPQETPLDTPQCEKANAEGSAGNDKDDKVPVPPVEGGPPPPALPVICQEKKDEAAAVAVDQEKKKKDEKGDEARDDAGYEADKDEGKTTKRSSSGSAAAKADSNTEGFAPYQTIVSKGGDEFEKASVPVVVVGEEKKTEKTSEA
ncbi:hypothetical protein MAPG_09163 [Magnaporthiopsis poae ATCC 64411]|uniref:Calpain catalytic domain-containing protein n=1 Tax=Magnaporthiopsis poae (strain ATCC 64411 / 73-15) TaxID=644358 RepID=A0A0C4E984_MAGP6|nr:hypothetical protein MAPG_09163 [Magnaporthiopsis poae ATCC 64411]